MIETSGKVFETSLSVFSLVVSACAINSQEDSNSLSKFLCFTCMDNQLENLYKSIHMHVSPFEGVNISYGGNALWIHDIMMLY